MMGTTLGARNSVVNQTVLALIVLHLSREEDLYKLTNKYIISNSDKCQEKK